jgi:DNA replication protein DnaC
MVLEVARCEFLLRKENVLLPGNSGTGKTHIVSAATASASPPPQPWSTN